MKIPSKLSSGKSEPLMSGKDAVNQLFWNNHNIWPIYSEVNPRDIECFTSLNFPTTCVFTHILGQCFHPWALVFIST